MSVRYPKTKSPFGREEEEKSQRLQAKKPVAESLFGGEETDGAFDVQMDEGPKDIEKRPGDAEVIPPRMETALQAGGGDLASVTPQRQPQLEGAKEAPAPAEEEPQGLFEDVTDIDARQERERQAFADELAARKAEQQQQAEARAGLGGMGLSGATAELTADIGRQAERAGDIAMADLARRQQQETFDELRRQASIWTFEEEFGVDLDGDGKFGSGEQADGGQPEAFSVDMTAGQAARGGILPYGTKPPENSTLVQQGSPGTYDTYKTDDGRVYYIENESRPKADMATQLRQAQRGQA